MEQYQGRIPKQDIIASAKRIRYVGHPLRFRILEYLDIHGAANVSTLMDYLNADQVVISQSLRRLRRDDLVRDKRVGKFVYYELKGEAISRLFRCIRRCYTLWRKGGDCKLNCPKEHLPVDFLTRISEKISFLGHPMRLQIVEFLFAHGAACVGEIMKDLKAEQVPVSLSLKKMRAASIVHSQRDGQYIFYEIVADLPRTMMECMHINLSEAIKP